MKVLYIIPGQEKSNAFIFAKREFELVKSQMHCDAEVCYFNTNLSPISLLKNFYKLQKIIAEKNIDIIHSQYGTITSLCALLVSFRKKLVITFRGSDINGSKDVSKVRSYFAKVCSWISMSFANEVIFVSRSLKSNSPQFYTSSRIIPSGVNLSIFQPLDMADCKKQLGLDPIKKYIFFYSSYGSLNKRRDLADSALNYLNGSGHNDLELFVVDGGIEQSLMPTYLNAMNVVLMLSDLEGSPTIVQEALACGLPVVSVSVGDAEEMTSGVTNSVIVERDVVSIANGVLWAIMKGKIQPDLNVLSRFSLQSCVSKILDVYRGLSK